MKEHKLTAAAKHIHPKIWNPATRRAAVFLSISILFILSIPGAAHAQHQQGGQSVRDAIEGAVKTIYEDWRLPLSALGIVIAIGLYMWSDPRGRVWAIRIVVAVVLFALAPYILTMLSDWAGGSGAFDFGH